MISLDFLKQGRSQVYPERSSGGITQRTRPTVLSFQFLSTFCSFYGIKSAFDSGNAKNFDVALAFWRVGEKEWNR
ncbi:MAG: hypothetical protein DRJ61_10755 [Acidobacteria bacterium]|nr:MAG: hypothetical protein DRJ61_10755 [Acidobacteriota bacterium]